MRKIYTAEEARKEDKELDARKEAFLGKWLPQTVIAVYGTLFVALFCYLGYKICYLIYKLFIWMFF